MNGPRALRGHGKELYGIKGLTIQEKKQVDGDAVIAERCAWIAHQMHSMGRPFLIEQPRLRQGQPHMFRMAAYVALRRLPGVRCRSFVQCPLGR